MAAAGRHAVGPRQGQVRRQRSRLERPAGGRQLGVDDPGELDELARCRSGCRATARAAARATGRPRRRRSTTSNGATSTAAARSASVAGWTRSSRVGPRNRSVRCRPSRRTQRTSRPPPGTPSARTDSTMCSIAADASAGSGTATNRRRPGRSAPGQRGRRAPAVTRAVGPVSRSQTSRSVAQDLERPLALAPADDVDVLVLERLVCLEEVLDLDQAVRPDLLEPFDVLLVGVADGDAQHLEVEALLVAHLQAADRAAPRRGSR